MNKNHRTLLGVMGVTGVGVAAFGFYALVRTIVPHLEVPVTAVTPARSEIRTSAEVKPEVDVYYRRAMDGSLVLVREENNAFKFYRDLNGDNCADTEGSGFYMMGLSQPFDERELPDCIDMRTLETSLKSTRQFGMPNHTAWYAPKK